ncbi:MAG: GGDEF domain-containing protein [Woeseiaceae bacterium]|nr:GGDEF domain-containing protein [Woeseiaceae bacterium]
MERPYQAELETQRYALKFRNRRLEAEFQSYAAGHNGAALRIQLLLAALLVCIVTLFDHVLLEPAFAARASLLRLGIMIPPILLMLMLTCVRGGRPWLQAAGVLVGLAVGLTSLYIATLAVQYGTPRVFAGYQIITVFVYFFLGLRVQVAVATAVILFLAYLATAVMYNAPVVATAYNALYLLFLNVVGALGAYQLSRARRTVFLEERILNYRANHDALTRLPNRRAFDALLASAWDSAQSLGKPLAILMLDIDHFKAYNDLYGHQAGDRAIAAVAGILNDNLQRPQDFAGRYGGEEFVLLLFDASREFTIELAERIRRQVLERNIEHSHSSAADCVSVSIGLAWLAPDAGSRSRQGFVQMADEALYAAKAAGRNRVVDAAQSDRSTTTGIFRVMALDDEQGVADALAATRAGISPAGS